jgi:hypothetical protein
VSGGPITRLDVGVSWLSSCHTIEPEVSLSFILGSYYNAPKDFDRLYNGFHIDFDVDVSASGIVDQPRTLFLLIVKGLKTNCILIVVHRLCSHIDRVYVTNDPFQIE